MPPRVTVIGSANVDFVMQAPHLPEVGETVMGCSFVQAFGGKGANQAVAAARAGGRVRLVAALGNDPYADIMLENFRADGIETKAIFREGDIATGSALIMVAPSGDNYLTVAPGSNYRLTAERVESVVSLITDSDWIILQQEIPLETNLRVLELAERHGIPVMLNYAPAHDLRLRPNAAVQALIVNEVEAAALAGQPLDGDDPAAAGQLAEELRQVGGHCFVAITLGKAGVVFADESGVHQVAAFPVKAVDSTAAGDTFCGALAVALGEGQEITTAMRFASAAAALSVTRVGAQSSIPTRAEIETLLRA